MKNHFFKSIISVFFLLNLTVAQSHADNSVVLTGTLEQAACPGMCGFCCASYLLEDSSGELQLSVGKSAVDLSPLSDKGILHRFTGSFYETTGLCGVNQCTLFAIETVDEPPAADAVYDEQTAELIIPSATMSSTGEKFTVTLAAPFNIKSITEIGKNKFALQGESCTVASGAQCDTGLSCLSYYGIAGPSGPEFRTCEISCAAPGSQCPNGQACVTVADGPGQVCQAVLP
ncbi:MAG: hypothetical protein Q8L20_05615 [Gammaproteobacteria bacterium]|nr:hypothetical protein [Gammaproteobacteria bacterium]